MARHTILELVVLIVGLVSLAAFVAVGVAAAGTAASRMAGAARPWSPATISVPEKGALRVEVFGRAFRIEMEDSKNLGPEQ
ncbi:MAG: hypothetical protein NUW23_08500 [Firmicutes bacterium]|jgi:hypothetical protein|nr:hypothetical protein [Bacillota bacterium]